MPKVTVLASCQLNGAESVTVQLLRTEDMPAIERTITPGIIRVVRPPQPTIIDPKQFPDVAADIVRMFAAASTELAGIRARKRPLWPPPSSSARSATRSLPRPSPRSQQRNATESANVRVSAPVRLSLPVADLSRFTRRRSSSS